MKQKMRFTIALFGMLCLAAVASGAPPAISGPDTVCVGSSGNYSVTPVWYLHYVWSVTPQGNITSSNIVPSVTILWGATGVAVITVQEIDTNNIVVGTLTLPVTIEPLPAPTISANVIVGCQTLADTSIQHTFGQHIINDSTGCVKVCEGSIVTYTANGPTGSLYGWSIVGGTILAIGADTCEVMWGVAGAGSVTVTDTSVYGCIGVKSVCIDIINKPHAHFYAMGDSTLDTITVCLDANIVFVDSSVAVPGSPIVSWFWNFGDGGTFTTSSSTSLLHEYTAPGTYTAVLTVTNACGCKDTFAMTINVMPTTGVTISCPSVVCDNDTATYSLNPVPSCTSYNWTVKGGTILVNYGTSILVQWNNVDTSGFGYVIFDASSCTIPCPGITVIKVPVIQQHGHISGLKVVCDNSQYLYTMPQWPTTIFNWTISGTTGATLWNNDQNNQIVLNTHGPGTVYLQCNYTNTLLGCGGVAYDTITVLPSDSIVGPATVCLKTTGTYSLGGGLTGIWTLTDPGGISFPPFTGTSYTTPTLTSVGSYVLTVVPGGASIFCPIAPFLIKVNPLPPSPDSLLGPDTTCFGTPTTYTAKNPVSGDIFEWAAVTGSCNFSSGDHTDVTFTGVSPATIMVWRETVESPHCHSDTISKQVYRPTVTLNITGTTTVCPSTRYTYNAGYSAGETYDWEIYNPLTGSVQTNGLDTAGILWNNTSGPAMIVLTVRKCDSVYTDTLHVVINPSPTLTVTFSPNPVCRGQVFTAIVGGSAGGSVDWNWGDGSPHGSGVSTTHIYNTLITGNTVYNVVVTVSNPFGCPDTVTTTAPVTVMPAPLAYVTPPGATFCGPVSITLNGDLTSGYGHTQTLEWATVAGGVFTSCPPPFLCASQYITSVGAYYVIAIDSNGCRDTSNVAVIDTFCDTSSFCPLTPPGWVLINPSTVNCGAVHLNGMYSTAVGLTAFSWAWGAPAGAMGVTTTNTTLDCSFGVPGLFTFSYTVGFADTLGDTCYITHDTTILVPIIAGTYYSVSCSGGAYHVTLLDHSNYFPGHGPTRYSWYINGVYQTATTPPASYTTTLAPGAYALGLWVYYAPDSTIDSCWATDSLYLDSLPVAGFTFARPITCANEAAVQFTNTSIPGSGLSYLWDFHDPSTNSEEDPFKVFGIPIFGFWPVTLTITNEYGCTASITQNVPVIPPDLSGFLFGDSVACAGQVITLTYTPNTGFPALPDTFFWMDGSSYLYSSLTPVINIYTAGSYWVHGTDIYGCYVDTRAVPVDIIQIPPAVITGGHDACLNVSYTLNGWAGDDPSITYQWYQYPSGSLVGTSSTYTDPAATAGIFTYLLIVSVPGPGGVGFCSDTSAPYMVTVHSQPPAPVISDSMLDCNTYTLQLTASGPPYGTYNWSDGLSGQTVDVMGGGPYGVWYTDTFGCISFATAYIPKDPRAYLWIFPTGCYEYCDTKMPTPYIVGPLIPWVYWAYQYAPLGPVVMSGSYLIPPWYPPTSGAYDLVLDNGLCTDTSGIMNITIDSNCTGCKCLNVSLTAFTTQCNPPKKGCCTWDISMCVYNSCQTIKGNITITGGTVTPPSVPIPAGYSCDTFVFHPTGSFSGGWEVITISWMDASGSHKCLDSVYLPPCEGGPGPKPGHAENSEPGLNLVPNPAQNTVRIDYALGDATTGLIEVYDMTGRMISSYPAVSSNGSWQLSLNDYASGLYLVTLKENGRPVVQSKLSVIR